MNIKYCPGCRQGCFNETPLSNIWYCQACKLRIYISSVAKVEVK